MAGYGFDPHFFTETQVGGANYWVQNDSFSFRFFPPTNARFPGLIRMDEPKKPGCIRIFIFGESAAMGDPEPAYGPARCMEMQLHHQFPGIQFEIVNVAFTAINSHVILPIARECANHQGDFWIIYMGNNEMVGPYGAATVFGRRAPALPYVRLVTALQSWRTGQWFASLSRHWQSAQENRSSWGGMEMFIHNQIAPDSPLRSNVYRNFSANLEDILQAGVHSGAKIILSTVAVNLRDCPPFASLPNSSVSAADDTRAKDLAAQARQALANGSSPAATVLFSEAAAAAPGEASIQYGWGHALLAQGETREARVHLQLACDEDALPFRTDSRLNELIRIKAKAHATDGVTLMDAEHILAANNSDGLCGTETFFEHVHFDFSGSYRLGRAWAAQIGSLMNSKITNDPWLSQDACDGALGQSDWNRITILKQMAGRLQQAPFTSQMNNTEREEQLWKRINILNTNLDATNKMRSRQNFEEQIEKRPNDFELLMNYAVFLQAVGDMPDCIQTWQKVRNLVPYDYLAYYQLGRFLGSSGNSMEAEADLDEAIRIRPSLTEAWDDLGNVQAGEQHYAEALSSYATALKQNPLDAQILFRTGRVYSLMHQTAPALEYYEKSADLNPENWEIHYALGGLLDQSGATSGALQQFEKATRINPSNFRLHYNYGVELAKCGKLEEARQEFIQTLQLEPAYTNARQALDQVDLLLNNKP